MLTRGLTYCAFYRSSLFLWLLLFLFFFIYVNVTTNKRNERTTETIKPQILVVFKCFWLCLPTMYTQAKASSKKHAVNVLKDSFTCWNCFFFCVQKQINKNERVYTPIQSVNSWKRNKLFLRRCRFFINVKSTVPHVHNVAHFIHNIMSCSSLVHSSA